MSLLSGIKFVPRDKRSAKSERSEPKKRKHEKKSKSQPEKDKYQRGKDDSDSEHSLNSIEIKDAIRRSWEEEKQTKFVAMDKSNDDLKFNSDHFKYLLNTLNPNPEQEQNQRPTINPSPAQAINSLIEPSNQNAAELLRQRLKQNKSGSISFAPQNIVEQEFDRRELLLKQKLLKFKGDKSNKGNEIHDARTCAKLGMNRDDDMDAVYRDNVLRLGARYEHREGGVGGAFGGGGRAGFDEEAEIDMRMFARKSEKTDVQLKREAANILKSQESHKRRIETCPYCTESKCFDKQQVIAITEHVLLLLKKDQDSLVENHMSIVPRDHKQSTLTCDEETQKDIERIKDRLQDMFQKLGNRLLFLETAAHFGSKPHAQVDVIPISPEVDQEAVMYFKQAFVSCDEEWAQHHKVINLTRERPLARAVPAHFGYLSVEWGSRSKNTYGGLLHPIESEDAIDKTFCLDVVAGMLDETPLRLKQKIPHSNVQSSSYLQNVKSLHDLFYN